MMTSFFPWTACIGGGAMMILASENRGKKVIIFASHQNNYAKSGNMII